MSRPHNLHLVYRELPYTGTRNRFCAGRRHWPSWCGVGILVIAPLIPTLVASLGLTTGPIVAFVIIASFLIVAAIIAQFGASTRQKRLDEVSP